jgi:hypothetical protein
MSPAIIAIALFGGAGVGAALWLKQDAAPHPTVVDARVADLPVPLDGPHVTEIRPDAHSVTEVPPDAGIRGPRLIRTVRSVPRAGGAAVSVDGGLGSTPALRGNVSIEVLTRPTGGILYVKQSYRGPSGTHMEEPKGSRATVTCTMPGYKNGQVDLVFDGSTDVVICRMERRNPCIPGLKNPFDDCPD